jgi:alginate O-acetyltransferase complex protein AlgI
MVFSSITFLLYFLPVFLILYRLGGLRFQNLILLIASVIFYAWGAFHFLLILLTSCFVNFYLVQRLSSYEGVKRRRTVVLSILINVGVLVYFKYANFIVDSLGIEQLSASWTNIALPIGISFFSFQSLSYTLDVHRKTVKPLDKLSEYLVYILSFPQMIAGPIVRFTEVEKELRSRVVLNEDFLNGFYRFSLGLAKKVLIANTLATIFPLDQINLSGDLTLWSGPQALISILAYSFQIYFDFSGYSDMAIGLGSMLGFKFPENFKQPYRAVSITNFWRRWHITLSSWMRDYLYIPLGGNRVSSNYRLYSNLIFVFAISGFWHGASWNFLIWGLFHGTFLILDRLFLKAWLNRLPLFASRIFTFSVVLVGWVFFAIEDLSVALDFISTMCCNSLLEIGEWSTQIATLSTKQLFILLCAILFTSTALYDRMKLPKSKPVIMAAAGVGIWLLSVSYLSGSGFNPFIYFRF